VSGTQPIKQLALHIPVDGRTGWGVYGLNLALQAFSRGIAPLLLIQPDWGTLSPLTGALLSAIDQSVAPMKANLNCPVIFCLTNQMQGAENAGKVGGTRKIGIAVFENPDFSAEAIALGRSFDQFITGSNWNADILRRLGFQNVSVVLQGYDPTFFHPGPKSGLWKNHFVIFSGGKLEYRKGQDITMMAVREFQRRHPETVLVTAWHNAWPLTMAEIGAAGLVDGPPPIRADGSLDLTEWVHKHGVGFFIDLGQPRNWQFPPLLREMDVALFPSRAEGATNFAAVECLACGVPTILSANTGHLEIISDDTCYPLKEQGPARATNVFPNVQGWGESSVDEILDRLEEVYRDRPAARRRGAAAADAIRRISWENQVGLLLSQIG
jgi:glycosyltransferase involved in cell wall biosynthesis